MCSDIRVVSFDLDDTLYEHRQYVTAGFEAAAEVVQERTGEDVYDDLVTAYFEDGEYERTFDIVLESRGLSTELVPDLVTKYHDVIGNLSPYPGVSSTLNQLGGQYEIALVTDGKNGKNKLERLGLSDHFHFVYETDPRDFSKHAPKPFRRLFDHFGVEPNQTVYVGNDPRIDFRQPNRLGMYTVRVEKGLLASMEPPDEECRPDVAVTDIDALPTVVHELIG